VRERWFGATGRRVPEIAVEGELDVEGALVLDGVGDETGLHVAHRHGTPVVVRAATPEEVRTALSRPEVATVLVPPERRELLELDLRKLTYGVGRPPVATYSIAACDLEAGQWGVGVESKFLAVGSVVPWAEPDVGAVATQAWANPRYGPEGLALLRAGKNAQETIGALTAGDDDREERQVGIVDGAGNGATFTGTKCNDWAGGRAGAGYAAQGNILVSEATVDALATTFERNTHLELAERLIECLAAAQAAGGDRRGQQSAALLVVEKNAGYGHLSDVAVDLRVDDHERPVVELRRLYALHRELFGVTPEEDWLTVDDALRAELEQRLTALGFAERLEEAFEHWAGTANLEERVNGVERVDPVVLEALRKAGVET
jgi:uncharacterized Ntn-hydrolase superfamily protein